MLKFAKMWVILFAILGVMAGCSDDDDNVTPPAPQEKPVLKPSFENPFKVNAEGGEITLAFTVENPVKGGELKASSAAGWILELRAENESIVATILANTAYMERQATIEVEYAYGQEKISQVVDLIQAGLSKPEITAGFEMPVMVEAEGGDVELKFTIKNEVAVGELSATADVDWLTIKPHATDPQILVASVVPNGTQNDRQAKLTVVYKYEAGQVKLPVELVQKKTEPHFTIEILETTADGVRARVTPRDPEMFYVASAVEKNTIDGYESEERYLEDELKYLRQMADIFGETMLQVLDSVGARGTQEIEITTIPSQMECYFFVYGVTYEDNPKVLTPLYKEAFTTK